MWVLTQEGLAEQIRGEHRFSELVLDGGNLVYGKQVAVTTEKFYQDNAASGKSREVLLQQLREELGIERIFVLPRQPFDPTGHADGMVRLLDDSRLLVADYAYEQPWWRIKMDRALRQTGLELIPFPCEPTEDRNSYGDYTARGIYINFLHIGKLIILPQFDLKTDAEAVNVTQELYPDHVIETLNCNEIVKEGGVLNCVSRDNLEI
jgi:agmatine deiminase